MKKVLLSLIIIIIFINIATLNKEHNWGGDFSGYIGQSRALVENKINNLVNASDFRVSFSEKQVGPDLYPWGYPLILTPVIILFGANILILKIVTYIFFISSLIILYYLFKAKLDKHLSLILILLIATSPFFFLFKQNVLSDIPAMFFLLLSVFLIQKIYCEKKRLKAKRICLIILGFSMFMSVFIRTNSIIIFILLPLVQLIEYKKWFHRFSNIIDESLPYLISLITYLLVLVILPSGSYAANHSLLPNNFLNQVAYNFYYYLDVFAKFFGNKNYLPNFLGIHKTYLFNAIYNTSIFFFVLGFLKDFKKYYLYTLFSILTFGLFLIYPYQQGLRFIITLIPFYLFFVILGLQIIDFKNIVRLSSKKIIYTLGIFLLIFFSIQNLTIFKVNNSLNGPYANNSIELFKYVKNNIPEEETIVFFKPRVMYLFTERKSVKIDSVKFLKESEINYFVFTKNIDKENTQNYLKQNNKMVFENKQFQVYKLK